MLKNLLLLPVIFAVLLISVFPADANNQLAYGPATVEIGRWHAHLSFHRFEVDASDKGFLSIVKNAPDLNIRAGFLLFNGRLISLHNFLNSSNTQLNRDIQLRSRNRFMVFLRGTPSASLILNISAKSLTPPPEVTISASSASIISGQSTTLTWNTSHADSCAIEPDLDSVPVNGSVVVSPAKTMEYTITATGEGGTATAGVTVTVTYPQPTASITAFPEKIMPGDTAFLTWNTTHADAVTIEPDIGGTGPSGSATIMPGETTTYMISASGPGGTAIDSSKVQVVDPAPVVNFSATPMVVNQGGEVLLSWTSSNSLSAHIDNGIGNVPLEGSIPLFPDYTTTYTLSVVGTDGSTTSQVTVMVLGEPAALPAGSFSAGYRELIPPDATVGTYDADRFTLVTGAVQDLNGKPLDGVTITIHNRPEYGTTFTDADGRFSIPVEGGGIVTIAYRKEGLLTAHRKIDAAWNQIVVIETIQMLPEDPVATTVRFDGAPDTVFTHRSSEVSDEFGNRALSIVVTGDNSAYLVDRDGKDVKELATVRIRATEFLTPQSMPALLPTNSAYTYCAELSVDGVQRVRFAEPVIVWIDNFLGFNVGEIVPVGYYDRDRGVWVPSDNGVVVRLLDTDADGAVDALDATGDNQPDDLNSNGVYTDEVKGLRDSGSYAPGATFWRMAVTHFTPWDCNWPYVPPDDAVYPDPPNGLAQDGSHDDQPCRGEKIASHVYHRSRVYHEDIPVPGTDITLHYAGDRVKDFQYRVHVPITGSEVPANIMRVIIKMEVAGRTYSQEFPPEPNLSTKFSWNGEDFNGNRVTRPVAAVVSIGYVYKAFYSLGQLNGGPAFGRAGRNRGSGWIVARREIVFWKTAELKIQPFPGVDLQDFIAEGWTLSVQHQLSPADPGVLHKGDGAVVNNNVTWIIDTVAGGGDAWAFPDQSGPARDMRLESVTGIALDASGNLYISEGGYSGRHMIYRVDTWGIAHIIAGRGSRGFSGDGGPAAEAYLDDPSGLTLDIKGHLYFADRGNNRIRKIDTNGIINTVAGGNQEGFTGDGGPAVEALLSHPNSPHFDAAGNLYFADVDNNRIRKVATNGIIVTVAGNGENGIDGDNGPAVEAQLIIHGFFADRDGNFYISQGGSHNSIRKVDTAGIIRRLVGAPGTNRGWGGDGGPAIEAQLDFPTAMVTDKRGNLFFGDGNAPNTGPPRIRKIDSSGIVTTVSGPGLEATGLDGSPATRAGIYPVTDLALDGAGLLYIGTNTRWWGSRVRIVGPPAALSQGLAEDDFAFADPNGQGYIMSRTGRHKKTVDLTTAAVLKEFDYDTSDLLDSITDQFHNQTRIMRDADGVPTAIISPDGIRTDLTIDSENRLTRVTLPDGSAYRFEYKTLTPYPAVGAGVITPPQQPGAYSAMIAEVEPEGNRFDHAFDTGGKITDIYDEEGGHWHYSRYIEEDGLIITEITGGEGSATNYTDRHHDNGAFESVITGPAGDRTFYEESADGMALNKTLPCGTQLSFERSLDPEYYYPFTSEMSETTPSGLQRIMAREIEYTGDENYDHIKDLITEKVTINNKLYTYETDTFHSQKSTTTPEGRAVIIGYDPATLLPQRVQVPGILDTDYSYNDEGRLFHMKQGDREFLFGYDTNGFLTSITDPEKRVTRYSHDAMGRVISIWRPDGSSIGFNYDRNGNMIVLTNPKSVAHAFGYNTVNLNRFYESPRSGSYSYIYDRERRLLETILPSGQRIKNIYTGGRLIQIQTPEGPVDFTYQCGSNLQSIKRDLESISYEYDGNLLTAESISGTLNKNLLYSYNNDFRLTRLMFPSGDTKYTYDDDGLLTSAGAFNIERNAGNGLPEAVSDGVLNIDYLFNGYGEIETRQKTAAAKSISSWTLTRDNNGRITRKVENVGGVTTSYLYTYDWLGRLQTVTKNNELVEEYSYHATGTRSYEMNLLRGTPERFYYYDNEDHLLTADTTTFQYDLDGFLASRIAENGTTTYEYSSRGELLGVGLPGGRIVEYIHDPLGRRIAKQVNGVIVEKYLWHSRTRLLAVFDASDNLIMRFEYAADRMPEAMIHSGKRYYLGYDQVGSLRIVADTAGNVVKRIEYDSFGNIIEDSDKTFAVPLGFAGGLHDPDTGLVRFGFRDYDPDNGRWTAKDPIGFVGGDTDLYGYVLNDPIKLIDPFGLSSTSVPSKRAGSNPLPNFPSFSEAFPSSDFAAPVADIVVGGLEAGGAVAAGVAAGVSFLAGPEFWWITVPTTGASINAAWDAYSRIKTGIQRLETGSPCQ